MNRLYPLHPRPWLFRLLRAPGHFWLVYNTALDCGLRPDEARQWAWGQTRLLMRRRI
jgi:hypothetical protein